jgi:anti-sigma B factor antagonist
MAAAQKVGHASFFGLADREADMESEYFSLAVERNGDETVVVRVIGEIDLATAPRFEDCLRQLDGQPITVDFSAVTFMDASGISVLVATHQRARDGAFTLRGVQPAQMRVLEITGVADHFNLDFDRT